MAKNTQRQIGIMISREEYLNTAKEEALRYVELGQIQAAYVVLASSLQSHAELKHHPGLEIGLALILNGNLTSSEEMKKFIQGLN